MIYKDKNGFELSIGDKVQISGTNSPFTIDEFKIRSYGIVACENNVCIPINQLEKIELEENKEK